MRQRSFPSYSPSFSTTDIGTLSNIYFNTVCTAQCDECSYGACVDGAICEDSDHDRINTATCPSCELNYTGSPDSQCVHCLNNLGKNCVSKRSGCSGSLPDRFSDSNLLQCVESHSDNLVIDNYSFIPKTISGKRSNTQLQFYKADSDRPYIFFDKQYNRWRLGGGSVPTQEVSCATLPICF